MYYAYSFEDNECNEIHALNEVDNKMLNIDLDKTMVGAVRSPTSERNGKRQVAMKMAVAEESNMLLQIGWSPCQDPCPITTTRH